MSNLPHALGVPPKDAQVILVLLTVYAIVFGTIILIGLANYLLKGIGMYGISKKLNVPNGWLAFIPIVSVYFQGELSGDIQLGKRTIKCPGLWTILVRIASSVIGLAIYFVSIFSFTIKIASNPHAGSAVVSKSLAPFIFGIIVFFIIVMIGKIITYVLTALMRFQIHKKYVDGNKAVFHMIMGLFVPLYQAIYFFILRNKEPILVSPLQECPIQESPLQEGSVQESPVQESPAEDPIPEPPSEDTASE